MEVAIAADKEHFPRVIQIPRKANVPEGLMVVAKSTIAPPEGELDPLVSGGILKELVVVAKRRKAASRKGVSDPKGSGGPERVSRGLKAPKKQHVGLEVFGVGRKVPGIDE